LPVATTNIIISTTISNHDYRNYSQETPLQLSLEHLIFSWLSCPLEYDNAKYIYIYICLSKKRKEKNAQEEKCFTESLTMEKCFTESLTIVLEFETEDYRMEGTTLQAFAWKR
jgi:hypothetical protein